MKDFVQLYHFKAPGTLKTRKVSPKVKSIVVIIQSMLFSSAVFLLRTYFMWCCRSDVDVLHTLEKHPLHCLEEDQVPNWMHGIRNHIRVRMYFRKQTDFILSNVLKSFRGHAGRVIKDFFLFFNSLRKVLWAQMSKEEKKWTSFTKSMALPFKTGGFSKEDLNSNLTHRYSRFSLTSPNIHLQTCHQKSML